MTLKSRLPQIIAELETDQLKDGLVGGAGIIAAAAQDRVPVESGELRDAIHVDDDDGVYVVAGDTDAFYGHMVEHGTTRTPPRPFLVPAAEANLDAVADAVSSVLRDL